MSILDLEALKKHVSASLQTQDVEALGGTVRIRKLAALAFVKVASEHDAMEAEARAAGRAGPDTSQNIEFLILLVSLSVIDDEGKLTLANAEGRQLLGCLDSDQLLDIGNACISLNGFDDADDSVDRKKKSSKTPPSDDSALSSATT